VPTAPSKTLNIIPDYANTVRNAVQLVICEDVFEREFVITADMEGRNIYQLGLGEGRVVRLLRRTRDADRRPVAVAFDERSRVVYWTDVAAARIVSRPLTLPLSVARPTTVYVAGIIIIIIIINLLAHKHHRVTCATSRTVLTRRVSSYGLPAWSPICCGVLPEPEL